MTDTLLEARVAALEAFTGISESADVVHDGGQPDSGMSDAYRLTYLTVAEIRRDFSALERTHRQRGADHSNHLHRLAIKYATLKAYLDKGESEIGRALQVWPGADNEADAIVERVRCRFCGADED